MIRTLTRTERNLYKLLSNKAGKIVPYEDIDSLICCKRGRANLVTFVRKLRRKIGPFGFSIENHNSVGYRLEKPGKKDMPIVPLTEESRAFATEAEAAVRNLLNEREEIGFESQVALLGVAIGAIFSQLERQESMHYSRILVRNIHEAPKFIETMRMQ